MISKRLRTQPASTGEETLYSVPLYRLRGANEKNTMRLTLKNPLNGMAGETPATQERVACSAKVCKQFTKTKTLFNRIGGSHRLQPCEAFAPDQIVNDASG